MSSSGSWSGRVGALGAAAASRLARAGRPRPVSTPADLEELLLAKPPSGTSDPGPSPAETAALVEHLTMQADLRHALTAGDLVLRYQPIVELGSGRILAFETLCRWRHWSQGLLGPGQFMPLAEETGLIVSIGAWVMAESARRLSRWRDHLDGAGDLDVTVNLSAAELRDRNLVDQAARALDAAGLPAERLVVEVNEAAAYADPPERARCNLEGLTALGVGLAVDDVGAPRFGRRSGAPDPDGWLWALPVRLVKLDRGLTARLVEEPAVLAAAFALAGERGAPVVAKGVETPDQLALLDQVGCPAGQGFLFARPMDPADGEAYLRRSLGVRAGVY